MTSLCYESTTGTTNANRVSRVVLQPCTDGLRDLLRHHVPPLTFPHVIKQNHLSLPRLTAVQHDLILPRTGSYAGNYGDMDISLLYILLRNISGIPPHSNNWGNDPDPSDMSLSANIETIRLVRNRCVHSSDPSMSNTDFKSILSTIKSTMVRLDAFLVNGNKYAKAVDFLCHESMDPDNDLHYEEELRKQVEEDKMTRKMVVSLKNDIKKLSKCIPANIREQHDIDVQEWREEDKLYYETHSFPLMMQKVRDQLYVTFVGVPGSGKSLLARHVALKIQKEEGYEIIPVEKCGEIKQYRDIHKRQVFIIDDAGGKYGLEETKLNELTDYEKKIRQPYMDKSKIFMTCRETVFNEIKRYKLFISEKEAVIKLHSFDHALNADDKEQICQKYGLNAELILPELPASTSHIFPLLCRECSKETKSQALSSKFLLHLVKYNIKQFNDMQKRNKMNYATLVLCMFNENSLSKDILKDTENKDFMKMKSDTLEKCELKSKTDTFNFMKALSAMEGTYTKQCGAKYTFIDDSMFKICAYHYGKQFPKQMLLYGSSGFISNYVKPQRSEPGIVNKMKEKRGDSQSSEGDESSNANEGNKKKSDDKNSEREELPDLCIRLHEDLYQQLAERLCRDIQNMELYDVFRNQVLKHPQVCQAFIGVLKTMPYAELKGLFLSSQGEVDKIASKRKCVLKESEERSWWNEWLRQEVLIGRNKRKGETNREYNVRVISWVIYYGHYQILEYIVQQTEQHKEVSELFGITEISPHQSTSGIFEKLIHDIIQRKVLEMLFNRKQVEIDRLVEEYRLLVLSCYSGDVQTVRLLLKAINGIGQISKSMYWHQSPLLAACEGGHVSIVEDLVKVGANVNIQNRQRTTPLIAAVREGSLSTVKCLVKHGADLVIQIVDINVSAVYKALVLNKPDIMKYLIQEQNKITPGKFNGNVHLFNCLVDIRHAGVKTDSRDDVVVTDRKVWCMDRGGDLWRTISRGDCDVLRHLLCVGLAANQSIQYNYSKSGVRPLLYTLADEHVINISHRMEKVRILLGAGVDNSVRVRYREYDSVLDREGVSVLERTRRLVCKYSNGTDQFHRKYKRSVCEIKKHIRRQSV